MATEVADVLEMLDLLDAAGVDVVIAGGWGEWILQPGSVAHGSIGGRTISCLSGDQQMKDHAFGYEPTDVDHADMRALHERLGTAYLDPYGPATP